MELPNSVPTRIKYLPLEIKMAMQGKVMRYFSVSWAFKMCKDVQQTISRINGNHFNMPTRMTQKKLDSSLSVKGNIFT